MKVPAKEPVRRILLVDDDDEFSRLTSLALGRAGIESTIAASAEKALETLRAQPGGYFDLILLDITLPGSSGLDFLFEIREAGSETPVIFVSARESVPDRVKGLRAGADDYVTKPVAFDELLARIDVVLHRRRALAPIEFGDVKIDLAYRKVERAGHSVPVSPREYDLLLALVRGNGEVMSREALLREVWDLEFSPSTNVLDVHLGRLRKKLDRHGRPLIQTVPGEGYRAIRHLRQPD